MSDDRLSNPARSGWTRRRVLGTAASGLALARQRSARDARQSRRAAKLTYWGGLIFSDDANKLLVDTINAWGAANGVETEVVMINQNETVQKVSAAVASNTMPDALDLGLDLLLLLSRQGVFIDHRRPLRQDRQGAGRLVRRPSTAPPTRQASPAAAPAFPFGVNGNLLLRRKDLLEPAGFTEAPTTWEELVDAGRRGQQAAGLRARPRALQCRRRQRAGQRAAILWRPHRRRRRQEGHHQVRGDADLSRPG